MNTNNTGIGEAINRVDGRLKVTGMAKYCTEFHVDNMVYAQGLSSTISAGRITGVGTSEAEKQPGVLKIITYQNADKLKTFSEEMPVPSTDGLSPVLQTPKIHYFGEFIGAVVAETFEQAQYAARLVKFSYEEDEPKSIFDKHEKDAYKPENINSGAKTDTSWGDVEKGLADSAVTIEAEYNTPIEHHHPMELHAIIASWENGEVKAYLSTQMVDNAVTTIAETFMIPKDNVRVITPYIGGGFGSKLQAREHATLGILASKMVGRPVQLTVTRQGMFTHVGYRQHNRQYMRLGADKDGKLLALSHQTVAQTSTYEEFQEQSGSISRTLYGPPNSLVTHRLMTLNLPSPRWMRAPGEAPGSFALESAMDELAYALKMDPVEFRIKNDTQKDLSTDKPYSSRLLIECLKIGAERFGWKDKWKQEPRSNRNGNWLVGYGMAASSRKSPYSKTNAKVILDRDGDTIHATVELDGTDIGTGSYTIVAQTAAEYLDIPVEQVTVNLGDSKYPVTPGSGGSWGAACYTNATYAACTAAKDKLRENTSLGEDASTAELMKAKNVNSLTAAGVAEPSSEFEDHSVYSFGANFAEVWVDEDTGMVRLKKYINTASAGKILNPKTAYSQVIGGITWGLGMALTEHSIVEPNYGNFITRTLADYHVPVNLDLADIEVIFIPEEDKIANPLGVKGIGELGITSVGAAIANAVFNATGKRVRDLPITPEKLTKMKVQTA